jgi:hypothetical protein
MDRTLNSLDANTHIGRQIWLFGHRATATHPKTTVNQDDHQRDGPLTNGTTCQGSTGIGHHKFVIRTEINQNGEGHAQTEPTKVRPRNGCLNSSTWTQLSNLFHLNCKMVFWNNGPFITSCNMSKLCSKLALQSFGASTARRKEQFRSFPRRVDGAARSCADLSSDSAIGESG